VRRKEGGGIFRHTFRKAENLVFVDKANKMPVFSRSIAQFQFLQRIGEYPEFCVTAIQLEAILTKNLGQASKISLFMPLIWCLGYPNIV
jgi:hypothetical protein